MFFNQTAIEQRIRKLQNHLAQENPVLLEVVKSFRSLDRVAYALGVLGREESFATRVPWWPMISVLGTFSSGKSTFINHYLGQRVQLTGNQAVDDRFTVICYGNDDANRVLPGIALDADPRFPFYRISREIEAVAEGEGARVDSYLQLKTCRSEALRGKILIDSPGFDADQQRNSTLRITDHIIDLSDLVLVFFDARHPEPGAMRDTLEHLVARTIHRPDANKFLFILNQIDNAAREDNPEEVFAAWQRALAQCGLTAGRFYAIYNPEAAITIEDPKLRQRFQARRDEDMAAIVERMERVEVERAYRIIAVLEHTARQLDEQVAPAVRGAKQRWRRLVGWIDGTLLGVALVAGLAWSVSAGYWEEAGRGAPWLEALIADRVSLALAGGALIVLLAALHLAVRRLAARLVRARLEPGSGGEEEVRQWILRAFDHNTRPWRPLLSTRPAGWSGAARRRVARVLADANRFVQTLNNRYADPSGSRAGLRPPGRGGEARAPATPALPERPPAAEAVSGIQAGGEGG